LHRLIEPNCKIKIYTIYIFFINLPMSRPFAFHLLGLSSSGIGSYLAFELLQKDFLPKVLADEKVKPPQYPWSHNGWFSAYDHARYNRAAV
jgi:hypothetical protein